MKNTFIGKVLPCFTKIFGPAELNGFRRIRFYEDIHGLDKVNVPVTCVGIERLQCQGI